MRILRSGSAPSRGQEYSQGMTEQEEAALVKALAAEITPRLYQYLLDRLGNKELEQDIWRLQEKINLALAP